ncbi:MAG: sodium/proline symporter [Halioglobus sp.]|nr:sodium/proline symporter [Halioglobus sp.]
MNTTIVLITLVAYKVLLVLIGFWAQRRVKSEQDFFLAGRQLGPWVGAVSYAASAASAWTLLGMSGLAYTMGYASLWVALGAIVGCAVSWFVVAPRVMSLAGEEKLLSATELVALGSSGAQRAWIIRAASLVILFCFVIYIASQFQGAGNTFSSTFGLDNAESIALGGLVILVYTLLGGFWAVSVTDTVQGLLMIAAALLLPTAAIIELGGMSAFIGALGGITDPTYTSFTGNNMGLALLGFLLGSLAIGISSIGQPHLVARFMALKDTRALKQAQFIATGWYAIMFIGMWVLGMSGRLLVGDLGNSEEVFFAVNEALFPSVLGAILLAAVLSAIMSTADSMLLVTGTTVAHDLGVNRGRRWSALAISRLVIAVISLAAITVAITVPATIFERVLFAWVAIGSALGPNVLCRALGLSIAPGRILPAMLLGFGAALVFYSLPDAPGDIAERTIPFLLGIAVLTLRRRPRIT